MSKQYRLFISHSWAYSDAYDNLIKLLNNQNFIYKKRTNENAENLQNVDSTKFIILNIKPPKKV